jgi:hypothetical protein
MVVSPALSRRLTGWSGDPSYFRFVECDVLDMEPVVDILRGRRLGVVFRGVVDRTAAQELVRRFWASPLRVRRCGEVCESQGYNLGAYHYHKPTMQYLRESAEIAASIEALLDIPGEPSALFRHRLSERLASDRVTFRPAAKDGLSACPIVMRHWNARGDFALQPHEDASQCREPKQADFEVQQVPRYTVAAVNICLENIGDSGNLVMWNIVPDDESKSRLGLYYAGSPYPAEVLDGIESVRLHVRAGDIYVFNGEHVHAVEASPPEANRTTMAWNMGFSADHTVVSWA